MAHEIAHQWIGSLVTISWSITQLNTFIPAPFFLIETFFYLRWSELWLNEGLATYFSYIALEAEASEVGRDFKTSHLFILNEMQTIMYNDALETSHAVHLAVTYQHEIAWKFDQISYRKGACIIRMLTQVVGKEIFQLGINAYLQKL